MSDLQKHQLLPAKTFTASDMVDREGKVDPEKSANAVRQVYQTMGKAFQDLLKLIDEDPRMKDSRIAHGIKVMQGEMLFDRATMGNSGDVLMVIDDGRRGVFADGSGAPTGGGTTPLDLANYFYLPGRVAGQTGHGSTVASGNLILASTANATKGFIYLGNAQTTAYNETLDRVGIKQPVPLASLHVLGEPAVTEIRVPVADNGSIGGWTANSGGAPIYTRIDETVPSDADYIQSSDFSSYLCDLQTGAAPGVGVTVTLKFRLRLPAGASTFFVDFLEGAVSRFITTSGVLAVTATFATYSLVLTAAEVAAVGNWSNLRLKFQKTGNNAEVSAAQMEFSGGGGGKTVIAQAVAGQTETLIEAQNSSGTALVDITAAGRLTVESGGSFRHVPGAGLGRLLKSDANGDMTMFGLGSALDVIRVNAGGTDLEFAAASGSSPHALLDGTQNNDTVANAPSRGSLIYGNATPKWDELVLGSAKKVLASDGTDAGWAALDNTYLANRTRSLWISPSGMVQSSGPSPTLTMIGTFPNNYHAWTFPFRAAAGNNTAVVMSFQVPADWVPGTDLSIYVYTTKTNATADTNGYDVVTSYISRADNESLTAAVAANAFIVAPSTTQHLLDIAACGTIANATLAAGEYIKLNVMRDTDQEITDNGGATNNTMGLVQVRIDYTADS